MNFTRIFQILLVGLCVWGFSIQTTQAQCTPTGCTLDPNVFLGIACFQPNPLPDGCLGQLYDQVLQIKSTDTLPGGLPLPSLNNAPVKKIVITNILNLPPGVNYAVVSANPADAAGTGILTPVDNNSGIVACIRLSGTPTSTIAPDTFKLELQMSLAAGSTTLPASLVASVAGNNLKFPLFIKSNCTSACGFNISSVQPTCASPNSGSITLTTTGGAAPFTFSLNGGAAQSGATFSNLGSGEYTVVMTDGGGCQSSQSVTLAAAGAPTATLQATNATCAGLGTIVVSAAGGQSPYTFSINGGAGQTSNTFSNLTAGDYIVTVKDAANCSSPGYTVTITDLASSKPSLAINPQGPACPSGGKSVTMQVIGGTTPYTFNVNGGAFQTSDVFACLQPGDYTFIVKDANGCADTVTFNVTGVNHLFADATLGYYPNPAQTSLYLHGEGLPNGKVNAVVIDPTGKVCLKTEIEVVNGELRSTIDLQTLTNGVYWMQIADWNQHLKFVKQQ